MHHSSQSVNILFRIHIQHNQAQWTAPVLFTNEPPLLPTRQRGFCVGFPLFIGVRHLETTLLIHIIRSLLLVEFFDCHSERYPGHGGCVLIKKVKQFLLVLFAGFSEPAANGFVDKFVRIVHEDFRNVEGVIGLALFDEGMGPDDSGSSFPRVV